MSPEQMTDHEIFTDLVGDLIVEHPCFYHEWSKCGPASARWIMHGCCPSCGHVSRRLVCGQDKNILMSTEAGLLCVECGEVTAPARHLYFDVEWLK